MKLIIEEGDVGGLTPGVYDADVLGAFVDASDSKLKAGVHIDMEQKPKPEPAGGRYNIEFRRFERLDPDDTVYEIFLHDMVDPDKTFTSRRIMANTLFLRYTLAESREMVQHELRRLTYHMADHLADQAIKAMGFSGNPFLTANGQTGNSLPNEVVLQVGSKHVSLKVGDVIEDVGTGMAWTVTGFPSATTWSCTSSTGHNYTNLDLEYLAKSLENGSRVIQASGPPPVAACDGTFANCMRHGNQARYGGVTDVNTGRNTMCPFTFGDSRCIGVPRFTKTDDFATGGPVGSPPAMPDTYNETPYYTPDTEKTDPIGYDPEGQPIYIGDFVGVPEPDATLDPELTQVSLDALHGKLDPVKDCDVCYGTGRFKGFGGPCSEGCPIKEGS